MAALPCEGAENLIPELTSTPAGEGLIARTSPLMKVGFLNGPLGRGSIDRHDDQPVGPSAGTVDRDQLHDTLSSDIFVFYFIPL